MLPCEIVDLFIERSSHRTSVPCVDTAADTTPSSPMRSQRRVGKKEGRALRIDQDEIDVWVWPVAGRRPGTRVDLVRNASAVAAAPSFPRQEKERRNSSSLSPGSVFGFLLPSCVLSPRAARTI